MDCPVFQAYVIRCLIDGKIYVGITSRSLRQRWNEHLYASRKRHVRQTISSAIAKHGSQNFEIEAVCSARTWADICEAEKALIVQYDCLAPRGYNLRDGGEGVFGCKRSAESIEQSAAKHRGKPCHPNTVAAAHLRRGVPKPAGHGAKVSAALTGMRRSEETRAKLSAYWAARRASGDFETTKPYANHKGGKRRSL